MRGTAPRTLLSGHSGMRIELNANGGIRHFDCGGIALALFVGNEIEGSVGNLYLRRLGDEAASTPLLGPSSPTRFHRQGPDSAILGFGEWLGIQYSIALVLARSAPAWFWHVRLENTNATAQRLDLTYAQDLALAPYGAVRLNEFYVSQYLDHSALLHPQAGVLVASRQNQAAEGRNPWSLVGSLRSGASYATDALQFHALATRAGATPAGLAGELPNRRLQHEHSLVVVRDTPIQLAAHGCIDAGFFGGYWENHPQATSNADLPRASEVLSLPEAKPIHIESRPAAAAATAATLFSKAPLLRTLDLDETALKSVFPMPWRHEERDDRNRPLSFFHDADRHVVLRAKELRVLRPHGHLLRTGRHLTPDESALTSTAWMAGVFHSMLTQGHVSINRMLSTVHSYLSLFRSHGQRVFVEVGGAWQLLDVPSAFEISCDSCLWLYRHDGGEIRVRCAARSDPHELTLSVETSSGPPRRCLISHHIALNGDDGSTPGPALWRQEGQDIVVVAAQDSDVGRRFPNGSFRIGPLDGTQFQQIGGDELLFLDGRSRQEPFLCIVTAPAQAIGLRIRGELIAAEPEAPLRVATDEELIPRLSLHVNSTSPRCEQLTRLADITPWFTHNALVHYLAPRGLEQYSGGGWGTRDVCQGPVEMLLALDRVPPIRDLLLRVMSTQNADGDWPQWFMFFERERNIRPGDSHGDIVFWPLLVLGQYLIASGEGDLLGKQVPFFDSRGPNAGERATVWQHVERALAVIDRRIIPGTALPAYGHGDWNDSLQPVVPEMRVRLCSSWTVTLHHQTLASLAAALRRLGRLETATTLDAAAGQVRAEFGQRLLADDELAGFVYFHPDGHVDHQLHPRDRDTGIHHRLLPMMHAIIADLFSPEQAAAHLALIRDHLLGVEGARLFDRPPAYQGGLQRHFQRAESSSFFGREVGLMYTHAHLRYAEALARHGDAEAFFEALRRATPIGIRSVVAAAAPRQANCYYSSSDAAVADRYEAAQRYADVRAGRVPLEGGWRVYSSGAGIAVRIVHHCFLGLRRGRTTLGIDPVIPKALDGLCADVELGGHAVRVRYRVAAKGCGPIALSLNGHVLPMTREANPYRTAGVTVPMAALQEHLGDAVNELVVELE